MKHALVPLFALLASASSAFAQLVETGPFEGSMRESFNSYAQLTQITCLPNPAFSGQADICSRDPNGLAVPYGIGDGDCQIYPQSAFLAALYAGGVFVRFNEPIHRFGGLVGTLNPTIVTLNFNDDSHALIDSQQADSTPFCLMQWSGWESLANGITLVHIFADSGAIGLENLEADRRVGARTCISVPNSTGLAAHIFAFGTESVSANDLHLTAGPVPDAPGIFVYGPSPAQVPFGNGFLCVGGFLIRIAAASGSGQTLTAFVDNTDPPPAQGQITAGSTWLFQAVFRDPQLGPSLGLSNAVSVTFAP